MSPIPVNPRNSVTFCQSLLNPVDYSRENRLHALVSFLTYSDSLTGMLELEFMLPDITHGYGRDDVGPVDLVFMALIPSFPIQSTPIQCYPMLSAYIAACPKSADQGSHFLHETISPKLPIFAI